MSLLLIFATTIAYIYIGFWMNKLYQKRLDGLEKKLMNERQMEFGWWKRSFWSFLMVFFWLFVLTYESRNDFRQWKYPYCAPNYKKF